MSIASLPRTHVAAELQLLGLLLPLTVLIACESTDDMKASATWGDAASTDREDDAGPADGTVEAPVDLDAGENVSAGRGGGGRRAGAGGSGGNASHSTDGGTEDSGAGGAAGGGGAPNFSSAGHGGAAPSDRSDAGPQGGSSPDAPTHGAPTVSNEIESVGFYDRYDQNAVPAGPIPTPLLLYKGGLASRNIGLVLNPIDIAYDRVEHPEAWPAWRRGGAGIELETANGWTELHYPFECRPLAKGTKLAGTFQYFRDAYVAENAAVKIIDRYRFKDDGTFETCKSTHTVVASSFPIIDNKKEPFEGNYEIDGYKLRLTYDDGTTEQRAFFYDPMRPTRLWLGTAHYPTPTEDISEICAPLD